MPIETTIYVVMARYDYEGSQAIKAFSSEDSAHELKQRCEEYSKTRPATPIDSEDWYEQLVSWEKQHPAGELDSSADGYWVREMTLVS
ncbi:MAG: hypothetical protein KUL87_09150 [Pseudomonas sp.]|nr:hypothetical protein [Pseudomonas sp.]